ncbi:MAG: winged helix-turn-helix domain-containing protein [Opitutaceae bacterium]
MGNSLRQHEIAERIRSKLLSNLTLGILKSGDRLPGVRSFAREFGVDARVILAAYDELVISGFVERRQRSGFYIACPHLNCENPGTGWLVDIAMHSLHRGVTPAFLGRQLSRVFESRKLHALVVDSNEDQIWSLADELTLDYGLNVISADFDLLGLGVALPDIPASLGAVVTTAFHREDACQLAERLGVPMIAVTMCSDLFAEVNNLLVVGEFFFIVSDGRMRRKLEFVFEESEHRERLRILVAGQDDLRVIPDDAPIYITRLTRTRLDGSPLLTRCLPEARVFSEESARELMTVVIQAGLTQVTAKAGSHLNLIGLPSAKFAHAS